MCAKMGRPKLEDPKTIRLDVKINKATLDKLNEIVTTNSLTKGEAVRQGIELLHKHIKK